MMFRRWLLGGLALLWSSLALAVPLPGDSLAPFTMKSSQGVTRHWKPGSITVVSCMAFWCNTWKTQAPRIQSTLSWAQVLPVDFIQIVVDGRYSKFQDTTKFEYWLDQDSRWSKQLGVDRVPYTLLVDAKGVIRWTSYGIVRSQDLQDQIRKCLNQAPDGGTLYLTFDDFPNRNANELLDKLRALGVHATFFCIGTNCEKDPDVVRRAVTEGHSVQMHSWAHDADKPELARLTTFLKSLGANPTLYRPPGSEAILQGSKKLNITVIDPYDFLNPSPDEWLRRIVQRVKNRSVIQLHSGSAVTLDGLSGLVEKLKKRGFVFGVIEP